MKKAIFNFRYPKIAQKGIWQDVQYDQQKQQSAMPSHTEQVVKAQMIDGESMTIGCDSEPALCHVYVVPDAGTSNR